MKLFRFTYRFGECGGVVKAWSRGGAYRKVKNYLKDYCHDFKEQVEERSIVTGMKILQKTILIWPVKKDDYYVKGHPSVSNCYGDG